MTSAAPLRRLIIVPTVGDRTRGFIRAGVLYAPCALGRAGISSRKHEGDGVTPAGTFNLRAVLYRPDRLPRPRTHLPVTPLDPGAGWCDDPADRAYNRPVRLPFPASHENLWRDDRLYDVIVVIDYNLSPTVRGAGSAIFLHIATEDFAPTAGCIAVSPQTMRHLLPQLGRDTVVVIK